MDNGGNRGNIFIIQFEPLSNDPRGKNIIDLYFGKHWIIVIVVSSNEHNNRTWTFIRRLGAYSRFRYIHRLALYEHSLY